MKIKYIDKLEDLKNHTWNIKNRIKRNHGTSQNSLIFQRLTHNVNGESKWIDMFNVSKNNIHELEFYGLKVIINEKFKLSKGERDFIERINEKCIWIARDEEGEVYLWDVKPYKANKFWACTSEENQIAIQLHYDDFNFITWESNKAWSKTELLELEVVD